MHKNVSTVLPMPAAVPKRGRGDEGRRDEGGDEGLRFFLESRKKQRTCVRRERKVDLNWKAAVLCAPVAGESLNRPDESRLSSVRFLLSPLGVLRTPCADLRSACHGGWLCTKIKRNSYRKLDRAVTKRLPLGGEAGSEC